MYKSKRKKLTQYHNRRVTSYRIAENFRVRKLSQISRFESHLRKFSPWNLGVPYLPMLEFSIPQKFSPRDGCSHRSAKVFSLKNFLLYGTYRLSHTYTYSHRLTSSIQTCYNYCYFCCSGISHCWPHYSHCVCLSDNTCQPHKNWNCKLLLE